MCIIPRPVKGLNDLLSGLLQRRNDKSGLPTSVGCAANAARLLLLYRLLCELFVVWSGSVQARWRLADRMYNGPMSMTHSPPAEVASCPNSVCLGACPGTYKSVTELLGDFSHLKFSLPLLTFVLTLILETLGLPLLLE